MRVDPTTGPHAANRLRLVIPELAIRPMVEAGCCVLPPAELITHALAAIPGIHAVRCDSALGEVRVDVDLAADPSPLIRGILEGIGYPVGEIKQIGRASCRERV